MKLQELFEAFDLFREPNDPAKIANRLNYTITRTGVKYYQYEGYGNVRIGQDVFRSIVKAIGTGKQLGRSNEETTMLNVISLADRVLNECSQLRRKEIEVKDIVAHWNDLNLALLLQYNGVYITVKQILEYKNELDYFPTKYGDCSIPVYVQSGIIPRKIREGLEDKVLGQDNFEIDGYNITDTKHSIERIDQRITTSDKPYMLWDDAEYALRKLIQTLPILKQHNIVPSFIHLKHSAKNQVLLVFVESMYGHLTSKMQIITYLPNGADRVDSNCIKITV